MTLQRLARLILMMCDRIAIVAVAITQTLLADMLGVQRPTVTNALKDFEREGLITPGRGEVVLLDRDGLMRASCECYQAVRSRTATYLPKTYET